MPLVQPLVSSYLSPKRLTLNSDPTQSEMNGMPYWLPPLPPGKSYDVDDSHTAVPAHVSRRARYCAFPLPPPRTTPYSFQYSRVRACVRAPPASTHARARLRLPSQDCPQSHLALPAHFPKSCTVRI